MSNKNKAEREHIHTFIDAVANKQKKAETTVNELRDMITCMCIMDTMA